MEKSINLKAESADALQEKIVTSIVDNFVENLHCRYRAVSDLSNDDVYSSVKNLGYKINDMRSFNTLDKRLKRRSVQLKRAEILQKLLDEYLLKQEMYEKEYIKQQIHELHLSSTKNSNYMIDPSGKYYRLSDGCLILQTEVIVVNDDGTYVTECEMKNSKDRLVTTYNEEDRPIAIKIVNQRQRVYQTECYVAKKLKLKKEYVNKYKLHGYSGNAFGFIATIKNLINKPIPSGYYLHESFNFYKWNYKNDQFEIQLRQGTQLGSPMLSDYDIKETTVVRTDYDGAGMYL